MSACLSEEVVAGLVEGSLDEGTFADAESHLAECERCMALVEQVGVALDGAPRPGRGERFGRYELGERLGAGGMGEVFRAFDTVLHRWVALKTLHPEATGLATAGQATAGSAYMLREARAAAGIEHPNAVEIFDVGEIDGVTFLAMELVTGRTLRSFVGDASIPIARRIAWLLGVARALAAAHRLGVVHRDVKPDNVMVRGERGELGEAGVKVLDFGLARSAKGDVGTLPSGVELGTLTAEGVLVGTPAYMAPEQMRGEPLDGRADQFAWGVLAYELLSGKGPWDTHLGVMRVASQVLTSEVAPLRARNSEIPPEVEAVVLRALAKRAEDRFATMDALGDLLEPFAERAGPVAHLVRPLEGQVRASEAPPPIAAREPAPRRGGAGIAIAGMVGLVAVAAFAIGWRGKTPRAPAPVPRADAAVVAAVAESQMSPNAEATDSYRGGIQAFREASMDVAMVRFEQAIALDPSFAAPHLRRALTLGPSWGDSAVLNDIQKARLSRAALSDHDGALLDAIEPWTLSPLDLAESERRFRAGLARFPGDEDLSYFLGTVLHALGRNKAAAAIYDAILTADPTFASAWYMRGQESVYLGDEEGARAAYAACLKQAPKAASCLGDLALFLANEGRCDEMLVMSRALVDAAPDSANSYLYLAFALAGRGEPMELVRAALAKKREASAPADRAAEETVDEGQIAILAGDLEGARRLFRKHADEIGAVADIGPHFATAYDLALVDLELQRNADVGRLARDYLHRREAWSADAINGDPSILLYDAEHAAHGISDADLSQARDAWLARDVERRRTSGVADAVFAGSSWVFAYAVPAQTPEAAALAMSHRPATRPLVPPPLLSPLIGEPVGRTYLLAGILDEAVEELTKAAHSCALFQPFAPVYSTWATFELATALEQRGDASEACKEYRRVLARWGKAKGSVTAAKARGRAASLGCGD